MTKPFGMDEVLARVRVALRHMARVPKGAEPRLQLGPLSLDFERRRVHVNGEEISLTPTEFDLLKVFVRHRGKLVTRQMLLQEVWGVQTFARMHSLHVYAAQLRRKVEPLPSPDRPRFIQTIPGMGYRFADELEAEVEWPIMRPVRGL